VGLRRRNGCSGSAALQPPAALRQPAARCRCHSQLEPWSDCRRPPTIRRDGDTYGPEPRDAPSSRYLRRRSLTSRQRNDERDHRREPPPVTPHDVPPPREPPRSGHQPRASVYAATIDVRVTRLAPLPRGYEAVSEAQHMLWLGRGPASVSDGRAARAVIDVPGHGTVGGIGRSCRTRQRGRLAS